MDRQTKSVLSGLMPARGVSRGLRNRLALTTILTVVPFIGYGRQAFAACDPSPSPTYVCSGANATTQTITVNNADVSTVAGFSVITAAGDAIIITGDGHLQFTDDNASTITGDANGLNMRATGDAGATPGAITITANSNITGGNAGIYARNDGSGAVAITTTGTVEGQGGDGIYALNYGTNLTITTGAGSSVTGADEGIDGVNIGSGSLTITANGEVEGANDGILAFNSSSGTDLTVTTGAQSAVTAGGSGIYADNQGSGALAVIANGEVDAYGGDGIYARNYGTNLTITTGVGSSISGSDEGIDGVNLGTGSLTIIANGEVGGVNDGVLAFNSSNGVDLTVTTGAQSLIGGLGNGIDASNFGSGNLTVTANGAVDGHGGDGIRAYNSPDGVNLKITTGASSYVYGHQNGINANNQGSGDLDITANGAVTGSNNNGIDAYNSSNGVNLKITTGAGSYVYGSQNGINASNQGKGDLDITANGAVYGYNNAGINAYNSSNGVNLKITTGAGSYVYGYQNGINANNQGKGDLDITANGAVYGYSGQGISAYNSPNGVDLKITTGAGSYVYGYQNGINANNQGKGNLDITANGAVYGYNGQGISAYNSPNGVDLKIATGAGSYVYGYENGIDAANEGSGALDIKANGEVIGNSDNGINARNYGAELTITTGAQSVITGAANGIYAEQDGVGNLEITVNGQVTGEGDDGIAASSSNGDKFIIATGAQSVITGADDGIDLDNHGYGDLEVTVNGRVTGESGDGIHADSSSAGDNIKGLKVTTGAASTVTGRANGIYANNFGGLDLEITVNGVTTGEDENGIYSKNGGPTDTIIKVGASGLVQGNAAGIYARSFFDGQDIFITNDGVVRNLSGETEDLAIRTAGGATTIHNNNLILGDVSLSEFGDTFNNSGVWNSSNGSSNFGNGDDVVTNSGTLVATGLTDINALETFNNPGLITLVDGLEAGQLNIGEGTQFVGQNGKLAVDAFLAPLGESDRLIIDGNTSGVTNIVVNLTNPLGSEPNFIGIPVVEVSGGTTNQGDFVPEGGVLNAGFFAWDVQLDGAIHELITVGLGAGSFEFAAGITGAQDIWHQTTGTLLQRQADLRPLLGGTQVTPVADFAEPVEPTPVGHVTPGLWLKGVGAYLERDGDEANNVATDRNQEIYGFLGGFDFGTESDGEAWLFGLFGGYLYSTLDFDQTGTEWKYEGPSVGAYATYLNDAFYADVTVKADFLDVDIDADDIAPGSDADTDVLNIGGQIDTGYKVGLDRGLFVEPQASLAVVYTEVDDIDDIFGGAVDFDDETSVRGRLGLRFGHELTASNQLIYSSDVTASLWQEFAGDNDVTIFAPLTPATDVSDSPSETFGDVALGFSVMSPEGWSSFLRANYQFSDDYDAFAGNAGVRYAW